MTNLTQIIKDLQEANLPVPQYLLATPSTSLLKGRSKGAIKGVDFTQDPTKPPGRKPGTRKGVDLSYKPSRWLQKSEPIIRLRLHSDLKLEVISTRLGFTKQHISKTVKDFNEFLATLGGLT